MWWSEGSRCVPEMCVQAFAMAMHSCHAHCGPVQAAQQHPSWLPQLISDFDPLLPSIDSVPLPGGILGLMRVLVTPFTSTMQKDLSSQKEPT